MEARVCQYIDEDGTRTFYTDRYGRGLFVETKDGSRQLEGTCDAGPFASAAALLAYVQRKFSDR